MTSGNMTSAGHRIPQLPRDSPLPFPKHPQPEQAPVRGHVVPSTGETEAWSLSRAAQSCGKKRDCRGWAAAGVTAGSSCLLLPGAGSRLQHLVLTVSTTAHGPTTPITRVAELIKYPLVIQSLLQAIKAASELPGSSAPHHVQCLQHPELPPAPLGRTGSHRCPVKPSAPSRAALVQVGSQGLCAGYPWKRFTGMVLLLGVCAPLVGPLLSRASSGAAWQSHDPSPVRWLYSRDQHTHD